jgi:hypothetical protein
MEEYANIMFASNSGKQLQKQITMLSIVYRNKVPSYVHTFKWFKRFREDCEILEMIPRTGHPSPNDIQDQLQKLMNWWPEMDIFTTEHGTKTLYRNRGNKATYAMQQCRKAKMSNTLQ